MDAGLIGLLPDAALPLVEGGGNPLVGRDVHPILRRIHRVAGRHDRRRGRRSAQRLVEWKGHHREHVEAGEFCGSMDARTVDERTTGLRPVGSRQREAGNPVVDGRLANESAVRLRGRLLGGGRRGVHESEIGGRRRHDDPRGLTDRSSTDVVAVEGERPGDAQLIRVGEVDFDHGGRRGVATGNRERLDRDRFRELRVVGEPGFGVAGVDLDRRVPGDGLLGGHRHRARHAAVTAGDDERAVARDQDLLAPRIAVRAGGVIDRHGSALRSGCAVVGDVDVVQDAVLGQGQNSGAVGLDDVGFVDAVDLDVRGREVGTPVVTAGGRRLDRHRRSSVGGVAVGSIRRSTLLHRVVLHHHHVVDTEPVPLVVEAVGADPFGALGVDVVEERAAFVEAPQRHLREPFGVVDARRRHPGVPTRVVGATRLVDGTGGAAGRVGAACTHREQDGGEDRGDHCRAVHDGVTPVTPTRFPS